MKYLAFALLVVCSASACSDVEWSGDEVSVPIAELDPVALSAHVPTFAIKVDQAAFDDMTQRYLEDIEVPITISAYRNELPIFLDLAGEVQIKGAYSAQFSLKPLGIKLEDEFDNSAGDLLNVEVVNPEHSLAEIKSFRLRNGGNDFFFSLIKDLAYAKMVNNSNLDVVSLYGEPAATFVNGEFYGLHNLRSESNGNGLSRLLGVKKRQLSLAELDEKPNFTVKEGDPQVFRDLEAAIDAKNFDYVSTAIDHSSFVDFVLTGTTFGLWDWPWKNARLYAVDGGPLHFMVFDFDLASTLYADKPLLKNIRDTAPNPISRMFEVMYADEDFRELLSARQAELMESRQLAPERLKEALDALRMKYEPIIDLQTQKHGYPVSRGQWYLDLEDLVQRYQQRYKVLERELERK